MAELVYSIVVVGAGGTGSYFLKEFSRYLYDNRKAKEKISSMSIIDGDIIERKNIRRQAFQEEDIGQAKATVLASVLNEAFDLKWKAYYQYLLKVDDFEGKLVKKVYNSTVIPLIIGCVDNHACRLVCEEFFSQQENCIYIDSANEFSDGEVVFAAKKNGKVVSPCRSTVFPDILTGDLRNVEELSCTELNEVAPQHITANMQAGLILLQAVTSLLEEGRVTTGVTIFNVDRHAMQHDAPQ